ncbi:MAG: primosomal protein N' [Lactobacillales bacterium]|jgi:primosomal protein N' (replication factor Y)|nr:primosomal protein N' [Lactobacillales bacterium]
MNITCEVIVDVPAMQTDQPYSYIVPFALSESLQVGMRVIVPFGKGNRLVQGFVVGMNQAVKNETQELKEIVSVMDLVPVLNTELLALADYMKEKTFSFKINCLQTMLPSVLRSDYFKYIFPTDSLTSEEQQIFGEKKELEWNEAEAAGLLPKLMKLRTASKVEVRYEVKKRNRAKKERWVRGLLSMEEAQEELANQKKNAVQKQKILEVLGAHAQEELKIKELKEMCEITTATINAAEKSNWLTIFEREVYRNPYDFANYPKTEPLKLNPAQQLAKNEFVEAMKAEQNRTFLLEGITGSGKTEVYLQTIAEALEQGKTAIMLVPEISLTPQMVERFIGRFGTEVAVLHSGLGQGEKYDEWRKIERKEARVVVGARSAIFAPLENLGVIIIDEEHEASYKQDKTPRYHARDLAIWRGNYAHCPVVLGSATPSLESRARAQKNVYQLVLLPERASENAVLPTVEVIDFRAEYGKGGTQEFTKILLDKLADRIEKQEQSVLMLNRRGYSSFMMCRECGYVLQCPNCDISLTLHMDTHSMRCHYCGHEEAIPTTCANCQSKKIRYYGTGTQKVEQELMKLMPHARILRMDVDTTRKKGAHEKILQAFGNHEADILLGTQMIAKGLDFPDVTLVGVLNADTALNLPDFRSSERTFQLLTQVSGRAGRGDKAGEVIIQTYNPEHYAIRLAQAQDYEAFYQREMGIRHLAGYPPYYFTAQIVVSHKEENVAAKKIYQLHQQLKRALSPKTILLGPTPKSIARVNNQYYYQIIIKYKFEEKLQETLENILVENQSEAFRGLNISIDADPMNFA